MGERLQHSSLIRPCQEEWGSGDTVVIRPLAKGIFAAIVGVLGRGAEAHELALVINAFLGRNVSFDISGLMTRLHRHVKGSHGAAVGLCAVDALAERVSYVGAGNTVLRRFGKVETRLASQDGVLGQNMRTPRTQTLRLEAGDLIVLYTDGVHDHFTSDDYPGLFHHAPEVVVRTVVERFGKGQDDAACIAMRYSA